MDTIEEIKSRLDIVAVISDYVALKKAGANYRALCPFHSEKTPSFFVSPSKQMWHCFGCNEGHDMFDFIMKIEGVEFKEALKILAQKAGVTLKVQNPKLKSHKEKMLEIHEQATKFFQYCLLNSTTGKKAYKYLLTRGINDLSIKKWRIGYSPKQPQALFAFLSKKGYNNKDIKEAGLTIEKKIIFGKNNQPLEKYSYYDRFQGRIIFPIFNLQGQVVAFGGRFFEITTEKNNEKKKEKIDIAKYINSPQTEIYNKSDILYGLDKAKLDIKKKDFSILVEGYTDVIMSAQVGVENVIASSGTALTESHLNILGRYSKNLIIGFDADDPGVTAVHKSIDLAQQKGFNIKIISITKNKDPAETILYNPKEWKKNIVESLSIIDFYLKTALNKYDAKTAEGKKNIAEMVLPRIKNLFNKIEQGYWLQKLAEEIEIDVHSVKQELEKITDKNNLALAPYPASKNHQPLHSNRLLSEQKKESVDKILQEKLLLLILKKPEILESIKLEDIKKCSVSCHKILLDLKEIKNQGQITIDSLKKHFEAEIFARLSLLYCQIEFEIKQEQQNDAIENLHKEVKEILEKLKKNQIKTQMSLITQKIKTAEKNKDREKIEILSKKYYNLSQKLQKP
jgi:DNA primase